MDVGIKPVAAPAIVLVSLACVAFFMARGATAIAARAAFGSAVADAPPGRDPAASARRVADSDGILHRNIFDSARGSLLAPPDPPDPPMDEGVGSCDGGWRLTATFFDADRPEGSIAAILDASGVSRLYRVGQQLGAHSLVGIAGQSVRLEGEGESCLLQMFESAEPGAPQSAPSNEPGSTPGITALSEDRYRVSRALVREAIASPDALGSARVVMAPRGGQRVPRIYGVRAGSVLAEIGLRNGDVLKTLGEHDLGDPDEILAAYGELERARALTLTIERGGRPHTLEYAFAP